MRLTRAARGLSLDGSSVDGLAYGLIAVLQRVATNVQDQQVAANGLVLKFPQHLPLCCIVLFKKAASAAEV